MRAANVGELQAHAVRFAMALKPREDTALVVTLSGDLGAGKTAFVQAVAKTFGVTEAITSPTFVLEKVYKLQRQRFQKLIHIDAYRLERAHELEQLGFYELLEDPGNIILIEWPERVLGLIPKNAIRLRFDIQGDERIITGDGESAQG